MAVLFSLDQAEFFLQGTKRKPKSRPEQKRNADFALHMITVCDWRGGIMKEEIHVACPCCRNKRLFDADPDTEGVIKIKCPICRSVVAVSFHKKKIRTERIATQ